MGKYNSFPTPWGESTSHQILENGIFHVKTDTHGGYLVPQKLWPATPIHLQIALGAYEEDCAWCMVALAFPEIFPARAQEDAELMLKSVYPEKYKYLTNDGFFTEQARARRVLLSSDSRINTLDEYETNLTAMKVAYRAQNNSEMAERMESLLKRPFSPIKVFVRGGLVQGVDNPYSQIEVIVYDYDNDEGEDQDEMGESCSREVH